MLAERYFPTDPNTSLLKLRQLAELLAQLVATKVGLYQSPEESQYDLLRRLQAQGILPREIAQLLGEVRRAGNAASHAMAGDHRTALAALKITWQLGLWFHRTFRNPSFTSGPFIPPQAPPDESSDLRAEITRLSQALEQGFAAHQETAQRLGAADAMLREAKDEQTFWEQMASEAEAAKAALQQRLAAQQAETAAQPRDAVTVFVAAANTAAAALHLDEIETRKLVDQQLRQACWTADSATLVYAQGARPEPHKNLAIAEWPTQSGPADYVLFVGLTPVAVVEAKRQNIDVSAALQQGKRYSRGFMPSPETVLYAENWGADGSYRIPFAFSSNGRPFLRQLSTKSGIWFCDLRRPENLGHALDGWYTPEGLTALLKRDEDRSHDQPRYEPFAYGFSLCHYQRAAIQAAEAAIAGGQRAMLLAMATGTGKTKTCIALIYRLLKAKRFRRVLFLVDRSVLGEQAANAFKDTRMERLQTFADIFGIKELDEPKPDADTAVHIATVQGMVQINTALSTSGIAWKVGEEVEVYHARRNRLDLFTTPDEIKFDVEDFNRKVITESFNRVVCEFLAQELDPSSRQKTLIFCVNDAHADLVVHLLKRAFAQHYGSIDDDAVIKITGAADKPLQLIRRYKNEPHPNVAVTVDLLTTGVDVPEICNLVFLRGVNSRILFDQMLGRATRRCDAIGKETFRIFYAVQIYEALQGMTAMQPVVVNPAITFTQLARELVQVASDAERALVRDQFVAKLQRKKRHLSEATARDFETRAGMSPEVFIERLKTMPLADIAAWFTRNPDLGEILDRQGEGRAEPVFVSHHADKLLGTERGYGQARRPEDYLQEFSDFIRSRGNTIPALVTVLTRPRELTRKQLRELALELDRAGFSEASLSTAWREMTNQDIAARIVGYIRQAAIGDPLVPYDQRVDSALQKILASRHWSTPQRQWLQKIAAQTKANALVDREALDDPDLVFRHEGGGFARLNRIFGGELQQVLDTFNESLWAPVA